MRFNYERAWIELAAPAFEAIQPDIQGLFDVVASEAKNLKLGDRQKMSWTPVLKEAFGAFPDPVLLAKASRIVHNYGFWRFGRYSTQPLYVESWKFSDYADQELQTRLGVPWQPGRDGIHYEIVEGFLRVCFGPKTLFKWEWDEFALATADNLTKAKRLVPEVERLEHHDTWFEDVIHAPRALLRNSFDHQEHDMLPWFNLAKYIS